MSGKAKEMKVKNEMNLTWRNEREDGCVCACVRVRGVACAKCASVVLLIQLVI